MRREFSRKPDEALSCRAFRRRQESREDRRGIAPLRGLAIELGAAASRELVGLHLAIALRPAPLALDAPLLLELQKRRVQRAVVDRDPLLRHFLDPPGDRVAV